MTPLDPSCAPFDNRRQGRRPTARTIRAAVTLGILEGLDGGRRTAALVRAGLAEAELQDPDRLLDLEAVLRLYQAAAELLGDDCLGLHRGEAWELGGLGVLHYAVLNAPTVGTGLRNLDRYGRSHVQGGRIVLTVEGDEARLDYALEDADPELARQHVEASAVVGLRIVRRLSGASWRPHRVGFGHQRPRDTTEHARIFGCPLRFGDDAHLRIDFAARDLERPVAGADRSLLPIVEQHLDKLLERDAGGGLVHDVRASVAAMLCDGSPNVRAVAKRLGTSVRTLQRRLDEQGVVFRDLVQGVRRELAERYLASHDADLTEIAFLLGYSELSAFGRAFRRWTGQSPRRFRAAAR